MRKGIVLLIVALMCSYSVFASKDTVPPAVVATTPTITLSQEQFDSLIAVSAKVNQMEYVSKTDCDKMFSDYINHVGWVVGLFGVLCTILVAIVGVAVPILLNRKFENDIKDRIDKHDEQLNKTKEEIDNAKKSAEQNAMNAKVSAFFSQAYYEEDLDKKIELYNKVIKLDLKNEFAYNNRGIAYAKKGGSVNLDQAIKDFDQAIALNPKDAEAYNNRGLAYYAKGDNDQAIKDYDKAIELNPQYALAYYNRGNVYYAKGNNDQAIKDYDKAIELNPQYAEAYNNRGIAYSDKGDIDQAIKDYDKAIELNPQYALAYNKRGAAYMNRGNDGDYDLAMNDFKTGLSLNPKESTRKLLERNIEKLEAKMQQPKEGE